MIDYNEIFTYSDQPVTCPKCGARTGVLLDLSHTKNQVQVNACLAVDCGFQFVVEKDGELVWL